MSSVWYAVLFPYRLTYITALFVVCVSMKGTEGTRTGGGHVHGVTGVHERGEDTHRVLDLDVDARRRRDWRASHNQRSVLYMTRTEGNTH